jgi:hypothetical protein
MIDIIVKIVRVFLRHTADHNRGQYFMQSQPSRSVGRQF